MSDGTDKPEAEAVGDAIPLRRSAGWMAAAVVFGLIDAARILAADPRTAVPWSATAATFAVCTVAFAAVLLLASLVAELLLMLLARRSARAVAVLHTLAMTAALASFLQSRFEVRPGSARSRCARVAR